MESAAGGGGKLFGWGASAGRFRCWVRGLRRSQVGPVFQDLTLRGRACPS